MNLPDIVSKIKDRQFKFFNRALNFSVDEAIVSTAIGYCNNLPIIKYYEDLNGTCKNENPSINPMIPPALKSG